MFTRVGVDIRTYIGIYMYEGERAKVRDGDRTNDNVKKESKIVKRFYLHLPTWLVVVSFFYYGYFKRKSH